MEKLVAEWQARLRLQDWRITVKVKASIGGGDFGETWMFPKTKAARVTIYYRRDMDPAELTVIHELIHLHMVSFYRVNKADWRNDNFEAAIDSMAWGYYVLKYPNRKDPVQR